MIVVVGAGPCGLFVASRLHDQGHDVLVLSSNQNSFKIKNSKSWLQVPGLGGRAQVWGGWLDFPSKKQFKESNWPILYQDLKKQEREVKKWLLSRKQNSSKKFFKLGFKQKTQAMRIWNRWPFKIHQHVQVRKLIEQNKKIISLKCWDEKKKTHFYINPKEVILCCSPFSTISLVKNLNLSHKNLEKKMTNHLTAGYLALYPVKPKKKITKPSFGFKNTDHGVIELQGPFSALNLDADWKGYEYYKLHYIAEIGSKKFKINNFKVEYKIRYTKKEKLLAKKMEDDLKKEIDSLSLDHVIKYKIQNTLDISNIAHESGGAILNEVVDNEARLKNYTNLRIMDASILPTGLKTYPTLSLLCLLNLILTKD